MSGHATHAIRAIRAIPPSPAKGSGGAGGGGNASGNASGNGDIALGPGRCRFDRQLLHSLCCSALRSVHSLLLRSPATAQLACDRAEYMRGGQLAVQTSQATVLGSVKLALGTFNSQAFLFFFPFLHFSISPFLLFSYSPWFFLFFLYNTSSAGGKAKRIGETVGNETKRNELWCCCRAGLVRLHCFFSCCFCPLLFWRWETDRIGRPQLNRPSKPDEKAAKRQSKKSNPKRIHLQTPAAAQQKQRLRLAITSHP